MADNDPERGAPMLELVRRMASDDRTVGRRAAAEVQRRWDTAAEIRHAAHSTWFLPDSFAPDAATDSLPERIPFDLAAIDDARQYLAALTLINELSILQRAGVRPAELFLAPDGPTRVFEVIHADYGLEDVEIEDEAPIAEAAGFLARDVRRVLFGESARVLGDHLRFAGWMRTDLLQACSEHAMRACTELEGAWTLESFLANPVGNGYHLPLTIGPRNPYEAVAVALGRQGNPLTKAELDASHAQMGADLATEIDRVLREDPPRDLPELRGMSRSRLRGMHAEMHTFADFMSATLGVHRLAEDHVVRLDGRAIAPARRAWVLEYLISRVRVDDEDVGTLTLAGAQITLNADDRGVVATVDAAGTRKEFATEHLRAVLGMLESSDVLTTVAKMRAGVDRIGQSLNTAPASTHRRRTIEPRHGLHKRGRPDPEDPRRRH